MDNTARDYSNNLNEARKQDGGQSRGSDQFNMPNRGFADDYHSENTKYADDYSRSGGSHANRLAEARERDGKATSDDDEKNGGNNDAKNPVNTAKNIAQSATPIGAVGLLKQINLLTDMPYVAAMGAAMLKDLLDLVLAPTVILPILFSALCTLFIFMMLLLAGSAGKRNGASKFFKKGGMLVSGGIVDSIPGLDFFPVESMTVAAIYFMTLVERKNAQN